jgi:hypothetical protein
MTRMTRAVLAVSLTLLGLAASPAQATSIVGSVVCASNGAGVAGAVLTFTRPEETFSVTTDASGQFSYRAWWGGDYAVTVDLAAAGGGVVGLGTQYIGYGTVEAPWVLGPFQVTVPGCEGEEPPGKCWLTGGGAKFSSVAQLPVAEHGPRVAFGGNVYPACGTEPGEGGQWNHLDFAQKLHFQGFAIVVDRCGNVDGIPPGSTSPATPFNFIEFHGTGVLKGLAGNKFPTQDVCFEGRAEDRNEPGSTGQRDGAYKDRYFIRVFDCANPAITLLVHEATPGGEDPLTITDGNLQIHDTSCSN